MVDCLGRNERILGLVLEQKPVTEKETDWMESRKVDFDSNLHISDDMAGVLVALPFLRDWKRKSYCIRFKKD